MADTASDPKPFNSVQQLEAYKTMVRSPWVWIPFAVALIFVSAIVVTSGSPSTTLIELLKVVLSWQVVALVLGVFVLGTYQPQIASVIARVTKVAVGTTGLSAEVQPRVEPTDAPPKEAAEALTQIEESATIPDDSTDVQIDGPSAPVAENLAPIVARLEGAMREVGWRFNVDQIYRAIYGSQIRLLRYLRLSVFGETADDLRPWYEQHRQAMPHSIATLEMFLGWLVSSGLMGRDQEGRYHITATGTRFLDDLQRLGYADFKLG